jgi:hypothetical protein
LDINLLKPSRIEFVHHPAPLLATTDTQASAPEWLEYIYRTAHPVLRWLPTKLAEWIGENLQDVLGFPDKANQRAEPGTGWTPAELNHILHAHVLDGAGHGPSMYWLFLPTLTPLKWIAMMFPWKTVGLHAPSSSSAVSCAQRA